MSLDLNEIRQQITQIDRSLLKLLSERHRLAFGKPWEEMFYLEIEANINNPIAQQAFTELKAFSNYLKILGCYPSEIVKPAEV